MANKQFICLISGGNRGIGRALVTQYLLQPDTIVVVGVRDPKSPTALSLSQLPTAEDSRVVIFTMENSSEEITGIGIRTLAARGITHLDLVIANAGIGQSSWQGMIEGTSTELQHLFMTNGLAPLFLFRQALDLMKRADQPKFVYVGSLMGSINSTEQVKDVPFGAMGVSKLAGRFIVRLLAFEIPDIFSFIADPGVVATEAYVKLRGNKDGGLEPEECAVKMVRVIERAAKEQDQGKYISLEGGHIPL
ncbi:hypothetical protein F5Y16DRAFT_372567 [Xylariaceae sp. FL0255]|nr:hypothetical protein F5Y16DRAFT_372567 [Xylariaceae sp. FL0255]